MPHVRGGRSRKRSAARTAPPDRQKSTGTPPNNNSRRRCTSTAGGNTPPPDAAVSLRRPHFGSNARWERCGTRPPPRSALNRRSQIIPSGIAEKTAHLVRDSSVKQAPPLPISHTVLALLTFSRTAQTPASLHCLPRCACRLARARGERADQRAKIMRTRSATGVPPHLMIVSHDWPCRTIPWGPAS